MAAFWVLLLVALALAFSLAPVCPGEVGVPELSVGFRRSHSDNPGSVGFRVSGF